MLDFLLKSFIVSFVMFITGHHHAEEADLWRETGKYSLFDELIEWLSDYYVKLTFSLIK